MPIPPDELAASVNYRPCHVCHGKGAIFDDDPCDLCSGTGWISRRLYRVIRGVWGALVLAFLVTLSVGYNEWLPVWLVLVLLITEIALMGYLWDRFRDG